MSLGARPTEDHPVTFCTRFCTESPKVTLGVQNPVQNPFKSSRNRVKFGKLRRVGGVCLVAVSPLQREPCGDRSLGSKLAERDLRSRRLLVRIQPGSESRRGNWFPRALGPACGWANAGFCAAARSSLGTAAGPSPREASRRVRPSPSPVLQATGLVLPSGEASWRGEGRLDAQAQPRSERFGDASRVPGGVFHLDA